YHTSNPPPSLEGENERQFQVFWKMRLVQFDSANRCAVGHILNNQVLVSGGPALDNQAPDEFLRRGEFVMQVVVLGLVTFGPCFTPGCAAVPAAIRRPCAGCTIRCTPICRLMAVARLISGGRFFRRRVLWF